MIFNQKECILFLILILHISANWRLIDYSFTDTNVQSNNWNMAKYCSNTFSVSFKTQICNQNLIEYVQLASYNQYIQKSFKYRTFQIQVILDVFFIEADFSNSKFQIIISSSTDEQLIYKKNYNKSDLTKNIGAICSNSIDDFQFLTILSTVTNLNTQKFIIQICFDPDDLDMEIGIRNMLIYVNSCYPTCLTCNGPSETDCLTCFDSQSLQSGQCKCTSEQQFAETNIGCRQECDRDNSIAQYDKICVQDKRIKSNLTLFDNNDIPLSNYFRYSPFIFLSDIFHPKNTELIYENCNGISFIGKLQFSEGMFYQMNLENSVKFLRIRLTFYLFDLQQSSKIEILHNNQIQSRIIKTASGFQYENLNKIFLKSDACGSSFTLLRVEMTFQLFTSNPAIKIQGQLQEVNESWGFRNVTIDTGFCQENCKICLDYSKCALCETSYQLYKNQCVQSCPIHSSNCVDYEDIIQNSRYIAKGFYSINMTFDEIKSYYDTVPDPTQNFATNQTFSFLNNKIVLGGLLVWNDGSYIKTWTIQKPHYAVSIYFNLTYGDDYTGLFYYKIGQPSNGYSGPFNNPSVGVNLIGRNSLESTRFFEVHLNNFYNNNLYVELRCEASSLANIKFGFCAVSDYFIVAHYCPPFCLYCISSNICTTWQSGFTSSICQSNQYLNFDQQLETYSCINCAQSGCSACISAEECSLCISDQFQLTNGICLCKPFTYLDGNVCIQCNRYCENCFGTSEENCLSCIQEFHRSIQQNQCLCQPGYYDDGINIPCLPKCGDQIIVEEEDCDDGNNDPFDGCDQCQFKCQEECQVCLYGKCYQCKSNYQLVEAINKCKSICGDLVIIKNEQCDDGNDNAFDGCHLCQLQCYNHCLKCNKGICEKCDEINGWYLTGVNCEFVCGDEIVAKGQEQCDDSNLYPFDLCNNCELECSKYCIKCQNGDCIECEMGFQYVEQTRECIQICGDNLIVENEQCEDQMMQYIKLCENCQFKCNNNCISCNFGICQQCKVGYKLVNNECEEICGDGQIVGTEVCDTLIQDINSNCYNCNFNCLSGCLVCNYGICEICKIGYILEEFQCKPICGDKFIVELELCDDGNLIQYDGCHSCNYSCEIACNVCQFGQCKEIDDPDIVNNGDDDPDPATFDCIPDCKICENQNNCLGCGQYFQLINNQCLPICGDGIIIEGLEECDDGNDLPYDGCFKCQFQCSDGCVECQQNLCKKCNDEQYILDGQTAKCLEKNHDQNNYDVDLSILEFQHYTNLRCGENQLLIENICVNQCGNGILVNQYEECDDGNKFGGDGCSSFCNIENSYKCVNQDGSLSLCTFIQAPQFLLNILSDKTNSTQILELTFTQQVKLKTELTFEEILFFTITTQTKYLLTISYIQNISIHLSSPKYQISIEFIEPIIDPILQVDIERSVIENSLEQDLQDHKKIILLGNPFVLPETTKEQLASIVQINDVMMFSMISVSGLALLTGNAIMFFNLLDLLQSLSYIQFMQYQFPPHVTEFLNTYTKVSLQPIMNYFQVDQLLTKLNGGELPYQVSKKPLKKTPASALNQCYLMNAKSCYFSVFASIITYLIYSVIVSERVQRFIFKFYNKDRQNCKMLKLVDFFQEKIQKKCLKLKFEYFSLGIFKLYQAILHQLIFSTLLQFPNYKFQTAFEIFNSIHAIFGIFFILMATFNLFSITSAQIKDQKKWKYFYFESKTQFWQVQFKSFQIYRILFYIMIIVQLINYPEAQSILLSMLSFFYLIYLIQFKPLQSQFELYKLICREFFVMFITGTFLLYSFEFSQDNFMLIGWIHIGMFCSILASNLLIDIYVQIQKIYNNYLQKKIKVQFEQERKYYYNHLQGFILNDCDYNRHNR